MVRLKKTLKRDKSLKNDQHRKAKRLELQQQPDYLQICNSFKQAKEDRDRTLIKLNQLRNEFSVMKLEVRMMIAQLEVAA